MRAEMSSNTTIDDAELLKRCQEGDQTAFRLLVTRYHPRIFSLIQSLVRDRDEADDLTQEVFIKAFRSLSRFERRAQFYTWLYRIAVNRCLDWLKSRGRGAETPLGRMSISKADEAAFSSRGTADDETLRGDLARALEDALQTLSPDYRLVLLLREEEGLSYEEIAEVMGCSVGTVKSRLFRGRTLLQRVLADVREEWKGG